MTVRPQPSASASAPRVLLVVAVSAVALLLWFPAASSAGTGGTQTEQGESQRTALISAGLLLRRWAGYGTEHGSDEVRGVQARLRRLGFRPGPIDGLFGPLTEDAVVRFQTTRGLSRDGVVGPATRRSLLARPVGRRSRPASSRVRRGSRDRRAPVQTTTQERAPRVVAPHVSHGPAPELVAGLGALAAALLLGSAWLLAGRRRGDPAARRDRTPATLLRPGIVCAALLAVFAIGAVAGALFAARAAPGDRGTVEAKGTAAVPAVAGVARAPEGRPHRSPSAP